MPNNIYINLTEDAEPPQWFNVQKTEQFINNVLTLCNYKNWELSVLFCSNVFIQSLNKKYRNFDEPTDVLSFSQTEETIYNNDLLPEGLTGLNVKAVSFVAGDIVISFEALSNNSKSFNVPEIEEFKRLLIHGILHLAGYDHMTNSTDEKMLQLQEKILNEVNK